MYVRESWAVRVAHTIPIYVAAAAIDTNVTLVLVAVLGRKLFIKLKSQYIKHMEKLKMKRQETEKLRAKRQQWTRLHKHIAVNRGKTHNDEDNNNRNYK